MRRSPVLGCLGLVLAGGGCYDIPPSVPQGYVGSAPEAPGWPPPAAYALDTFHPSNRWFQRAFAPRDVRGELEPASAAEPVPLVDSFTPVDRVELCALLDAARGGLTAQGSRDAVTLSIFRSDILQVLLLIAAAAPGQEGKTSAEAVESPLRAARFPAGAIIAAEETLPLPAFPPPLREGVWLEDPPPEAPGLTASRSDLRSTRRAHIAGPGRDGYREVLLRLRVAMDERGEPVILPLASECWELRREGPSGGLLEARIWRFDRSAWLRGEDPWLLLQGEDRITIHDPESPTGRRIRGGVSSVCSGCHASEHPEPQGPSLPYGPVLDIGRRDRERARVRRVLESMLETRPAALLPSGRIQR